MRKVALRLIALLVSQPLLLAAGCEEPHDEPPFDCDFYTGSDAEGVWALHADGYRRDCSDPELNGKLNLDVREFYVSAAPVATTDNNDGNAEHEADAFVERIRRAQYMLRAGEDAPAGLDLSGSVNTCEVNFRLSERLPGGELHSYDFEGFVDSSFRIYGTFKGRGPGSCKSSGDFDIDLR